MSHNKKMFMIITYKILYTTKCLKPHRQLLIIYYTKFTFKSVIPLFLYYVLFKEDPMTKIFHSLNTVKSYNNRLQNVS